MRNLIKRSIVVALAAGLAGLVSAQEYRSTDVLQADKRSKAAMKAAKFMIVSPTRLLVRFKSSTPEISKEAAIGGVKGLRMNRYEVVPGLELVDVAEGNEHAIQSLRNNSNVEYVEPDRVMHADSTPNDPSFGSQWGLNQSNNIDINAPEAWSTFTGDANFKIAVIDTGVDYNHPDLKANIWTNPGEIPGNSIDDDGNGYVDDVHGYDFVNNDSDPMDDVDHGTHCAGIIAAVGNNGVGIAGVNWKAKIVALKFLAPDGGMTSDAIRALDYCVKMGIKVSNNSYGGGGGVETAFVDALNRAAAQNHVFVAAAGNDGVDNDTSPHYPAAYANPNLISVAALDISGAKAYYSNFGATSVDIAAPGSNIYSTLPGGTYGAMSGTSMAAPYVTGLAALVYARNPSWTYSQVIARVLSSGRKMTGLSGQVATGSMIDAAKALATAISKVTINPTAVNGSASTTGTVTLAAAAPPAGALVSLSSNSTALTVSTSVTVPAGATTATFNMSTVNDSYATKTATVTASYSGGSASADVRIYPANFAQFVSQSVPTTMVAGQTYTLWFDYKNTGRTTWTAANGYRLLTMNTRANTTWGLSRIPLLGGSSVAPGATGRFMAWFYAPTTAGAYNVQVRPIEENVAEFGQLSTNLPVTVTVAADAARYISQTVPLTVAPGAAFTATITLRNVGTTTWSSAGGYTLASRAPWNNTTWGTTRVSLPTGVRVAPGASYTFTYTFTAPATAGSYNFQWQLLKSPNLFGDLSQFVVIKVK